MPDLTLGSYELDEDSNGDLIVKDKNDNTVLTYNDATGGWELGSVSADDTESKVINNSIVWAGHPDFISLQAALDFANTNSHDIIWVPQGDYGPIEPYPDQYIKGLVGGNGFGVNIDGGTSAHAIDTAPNNASLVTLEALNASTDGGAGNSFNAYNVVDNDCRIIRCRVGGSDQHGIFVDGLNCAVAMCQSQPVDNSEILLGSNSEDCVADGNTNSTITDNGTNNVVGDNS